MKFSEKGLRQWVSPSLSTQQLAEQLTLAGLEVTAITPQETGDTLIELDLTPNRGDCLSLMGVAREVATLNKLTAKIPEVRPVPATLKDTLPIENKAFADCPRYLGRMIRNIRSTATTPAWLQNTLENSDIRSIHPVVDILNYVMIEWGQPMHAFDADKVKGNIIIRKAIQGEQILLLDGKSQTLQADTLVIADSENAMAIAGIMGGEDSAVSDQTQHIFLESALFEATLLAGKGRRYGLHTDSQFRFERGVDPQLQRLGMERATALILEICGGEAGPVSEVVKEDLLPLTHDITLSYANVRRMIGDTISAQESIDILQRLGCKVSEKGPDQWLVNPPSYRYDMALEMDLIEEIVRVYGYNNIPSTLPEAHLNFIGRSETKATVDRLKHLMVDLGYQEVITYSFVDENLQKQLFPQEKALPLINPISQDMNVMRVSLWPSLLTVLQYNQNRQQQRMKIFEVGTRFYYRHNDLIQEPVLSGLVSGNFLDEHWSGKPTPSDFFQVKRHLEDLWQLLGYQQPLSFVPFTQATACHPGQCAQLLWQNQEVGILGRLHPQIELSLDLLGPIYLFELKLERLLQKPLPQFQRPSRFPEIRRDIAVIVDQDLPASQLIDFVRKSADEICQEVKIFDVYMGKGVDSGRKSIALGLILQHSSRTLIDQEVDDLVRAVVSGLEKEFGAKLRE